MDSMLFEHVFSLKDEKPSGEREYLLTGIGRWLKKERWKACIGIYRVWRASVGHGIRYRLIIK